MLTIDLEVGVMIDSLTDTMIVVGVDTIAGVEPIVLVAAVIPFGFAVPVSYAADVLGDVVIDGLIDALVYLIISVVPNLGVEVLADVNVNVNVCVDVLTAGEYPTLVVRLEELICCRAAFDCSSALNCLRVLQTWMPSYHV